MENDGLSLDFLLILVPAFFLGKVLVWLGIVDQHNVTVASRWVAASLGVVYAYAFEPVRDFGFPLGAKLLAGTFAGMACWFFTWMGLTWALPDKAQGDGR